MVIFGLLFFVSFNAHFQAFFSLLPFMNKKFNAHFQAFYILLSFVCTSIYCYMPDFYTAWDVVSKHVLDSLENPHVSHRLVTSISMTLFF